MMNWSQKGARSRHRLPMLAAGATLAAALLVCASEGRAGQIEFSSSLNPVGSGARALGTGGAFIGVADDATAASWNPAGLVQLEKPEFSLVYGYFNRGQSYTSTLHPEVQDGEHKMDANGINYASFVYPFTLVKKNMVVSLNYQRMFDMNKDYVTPFSFVNPADNSAIPSTNKISQKGYISTLTPAFAIQVIPELYLGVAVNIWDNIFGTSSWESSVNTVVPPVVPPDGLFPGLNNTIHTKYEFSGLNATAGFLVNLNKLSIGGVFKSPFTADVKTMEDGLPPRDDTLDMPMSAGLGVSYRLSDSWLVSLDAYWTQWSKFVQTQGDEPDNPGGFQSNPLTTNPISEGRLKDTTQVRLGTEYLFMNGKSVIPVRAGVFYDPEPRVNSVDDFFGFSLGTGYTWESYSLDIAYQFRKGNNVTGDISVDDVTSDITQHTVMSSLIYRF